MNGLGPTTGAGAREGPRASRELYLAVLTWSFTVFNSLRVVAYLPTLWVIWQQRDSSQHSILTWLIWFGANLSMAGWLHEQAGRRVNRAVVVSLVNATMCAAALVLIVAFRF